jgi:pyochelin biosynthetic protein PchC
MWSVTLVGDDDPKATPAEVRAGEDHTTGPFEFRAFEDAHFYLGTYSKEIIELFSK